MSYVGRNDSDSSRQLGILHLVDDLMKEVDIIVEFYPPPTVEELSLRNEIDIGCSVCYARNAHDGGRLLRCGICKQVKYCSAEHQKLHWKEHKEECRMICAHQSSMA